MKKENLNQFVIENNPALKALDDTSSKKRFRMQLSLAVTVFTFIYIAIFYKLNLFEPFFNNFGFLFILLICFIIHHLDFRKQAYCLGLISLSLVIARNSYMIGQAFNLHLFLIPIALTPNLVFQRREKYYRFLNTLFPFVLLVTLFFNSQWDLHPKISFETARMVSILNIFFVISLSLIQLFFWEKQNIKQAERLLEEKFSLSEQSQLSSLGTMVAGIAHEVNNPLSIIFSAAQRIERDINSVNTDPNRIVKMTDKIQIATNRIKKIVAGLRVLASDEKDAPHQLTTIDQIIEDTLIFCQENAKSQGIRLTSNLHCSGVEILVLPNQISQALLNMISNSIDAVQDQKEKWIEISSFQDPDSLTVIVEIKDSGLGLGSHNLEKIMTPFFTTKEIGKGVGLGLSLAKQIIEQHGGKIILNQESEHTAFQILLPTHISAAASA